LSVLRIFIPSIALEADTEFDWVLFEGNSLYEDKVIRSGRDALQALPLADETELAISAELVSFIRATLPAGSRRHVQESLPYLVEDSLMTSPEQAHVVIAEQLGMSDAMLATVDRHILARLLQHFESANIAPQRVFPVTLLPPMPSFGWAVVCEQTADTTEFFLRTDHCAGLALESDEPNPQTAFPPTPPLALQLAVNQMNSGPNNGAESPGSLYLYAGTTTLPAGTVTRWQEILGVPCIANDRQWRHLPSPAMNLLQGDFAPASTGWAWLRQCRPAGILLVLVLCVQLAGICIDWASGLHQQHQLDTEMNALFLATFPDTAAIVDAPLQMQRKHAELQHAAGNADASDFLPLLAAVTAQLGQVAATDAKRMDYVAGTLTLLLRAPSEAAAYALAGRLNTASLHADIYNMQTSAEGTEFQLSVQAGSRP